MGEEYICFCKCRLCSDVNELSTSRLRNLVFHSIAIIAFGMRKFALALATGILVAAWGVVVIAVHMKVSEAACWRNFVAVLFLFLFP